MSRPPEERRIEAVSRRAGGWAVMVAGGCQPLFLPGPADTPPAAGDRLRVHADGRVERVLDAAEERPASDG